MLLVGLPEVCEVVILLALAGVRDVCVVQAAPLRLQAEHLQARTRPPSHGPITHHAAAQIEMLPAS